MTDNTIQFAFLYLRVSTSMQARYGDSLDEQLDELKKYCAYKNIHIKGIFTERGVSAKTTNRPEYQKLIKAIQTVPNSAIIVKKIDRISRSVKDFEELMIYLHDHDVSFISLKENFDTSNAMGKAMLRIVLVLAQLEREQTSERISDVMVFRAQKGQRNGGKVPFGYLSMNKELVPYKKE